MVVSISWTHATSKKELSNILQQLCSYNIELLFYLDNFMCMLKNYINYKHRKKV